MDPRKETQNVDVCSNDSMIKVTDAVGRKRKAHGPSVRNEKERKWIAKKSNVKKREDLLKYRENWIQNHSDICHLVTLHDIRRIKNSKIDELRPWAKYILPYLDLKIKHSDGNRFIAEGLEPVRVFLKQLKESKHHAKMCSILVRSGTFFGEQENKNRLLTDWLNCPQTLRPELLIVEEPKVLDEVVGFRFGQGAMACGIRKTILWENLWPRTERKFDIYSYLLDQSRSNKRFVALDGVSNMANMGSIIRCAAAFSVDAIFVTTTCCDVWYRQAVRVSMGYIAKVPIITVRNLDKIISELKEADITCYAAISDERSESLSLEDLQSGDIASSWCCVLGNEALGIQPEVIKSCSFSIRIGMQCGVDSLSVSVAAGILLHGLLEKSGGL